MVVLLEPVVPFLTIITKWNVASLRFESCRVKFSDGVATSLPLYLQGVCLTHAFDLFSKGGHASSSTTAAVALRVIAVR
jgi:hypothetical protein